MRLLVTVVCVLVAMPAAAQSTFVGASLVGEIARFSKFEPNGRAFSTGLVDPPEDFETLGLGVSIGRELGERWGVAFEFVRPNAVEQRHTGDFGILEYFEGGASSSSSSSVIVGSEIVNVSRFLLPIRELGYEVETEQRRTTFTPLAFFKQALGSRVELSYLGGITFSRLQVERETRVADPFVLAYISTLADSRTISYSVGPAVGLDAAIAIGDNAAIVTGVRLHGIGGSVFVRPAVGLRWTF